MPRRATTVPASNAREVILAAAESAFSTFGYHGTSMRGIAETAGVAQALLHYHFKTKDKLYEAVFERRSVTTSGYRLQLLSELLKASPAPELEDVLRILFIPNSAITGEDESRADEYVQLVARVCVANDERSRDIVARHFDPIAQAFIDALVRVVPGLRAGQAVWCYLFAFSMRIQSQASNDRAKRLSAARGFAALPSAELVIPFVAAGIRAIAASDTTTSQLKARTMPSVASGRKTVARRSS